MIHGFLEFCGQNSYFLDFGGLFLRKIYISFQNYLENRWYNTHGINILWVIIWESQAVVNKNTETLISDGVVLLMVQKSQTTTWDSAKTL